MKRILNILALAVAFTSCNDSIEVEITPLNVDNTIVFNVAGGEYWGDFYDVGTANFDLWLYDSSNPDYYMTLEGFSTLPTNNAGFKLETGTYTVATTGAVRTIYPGIESDSYISSYIENEKTGLFILITSGTMTVALSGNNYTITTDFTGRNRASNEIVSDLCYTFTGPIQFEDKTKLAFSDIGPSTYTATGTPRYLSTPGNNSWSGTLEPVNDGSQKKYKIINWAGRGNNYWVYLDYVDGKLFVDNSTRVVGNDNYDGFFRVGYFDDSHSLWVFKNYEYEVSYKQSTRTLDFSGTVITGGRTYTALVGIAGYHVVTGDFDTVFSDFYENLKIQLTPIRSSSFEHSELKTKNKKYFRW